MRTAVALLFLCGLLALASALLAGVPVAAEDGEIAGVDWLTDVEAARAKARETGRPILAVFR